MPPFRNLEQTVPDFFVKPDVPDFFVKSPDSKPKEKSADEILNEAKQPFVDIPKDEQPTEQQKSFTQQVLGPESDIHSKLNQRKDTSTFTIDQDKINNWIANKAGMYLPSWLQKPAAFTGAAIANIGSGLLEGAFGEPEFAATGIARGALPKLDKLPSRISKIAEEIPKKPINPQLENIQRNAPFGEGSIMPSNVVPTELRGEGLPTENYPTVNFREDKMPSPGPEFVPPGEEESFNSMFGMSGRTNVEDNIFKNASEKFNMGRPAPESPELQIPNEEGPFLGPSKGGAPKFGSKTTSELKSEVPDFFVKDGEQINKSTGEVIPPNKPPPDISRGTSDGPPNNEPPKKPSLTSEILNTPRAIQIGNLHFSAPLRQGLPLITTKAWWTSWNDMFKAYGSEKAANLIEEQIKNHPNFREIPSTTGGKPSPSFAEQSGLQLTNDLSKREEVLGSKWLENIPGYKASNRAFRTYLNVLRSDTFNSLIEDATNAGLNPKRDLVLAKQIGSFVNNATGRGSLGGLEKHAELLNNALFAPRKIAGNIQMLNPANYIMTEPFVRKQYLKALLSTAGAWTIFAGAAKLAGADVSLDPNNADFGKIRIGNTRLDPAGGFQQYLVAAHRLLSNRTTSSTTGKNEELGSKYGGQTRGSVVGNFVENKFNPPVKFATDLLLASKTRPFNVSDQAARMFIPIVAQDIIELAKEDPRLLPTAIPSAFGMGEMTYGARGAKQTIIPKNWSVNIK